MYSPNFLSLVRFSVFWSTVPVNFLLRKYYNYLNNIDMALLWTSYMYGGFLEYYFRIQFSAFWSMHDKTSSWENANFKMYPSPQKLNYLQKKSYPPPRPPPEKSRTPWQETQVTGNILILWETLSFWKNISLPPPPAIKEKVNLSLQENEKISLLVKVSTTLKLPQPLWKRLKPPTRKFSISQKTLTPSEKFSTPLK